MSDFKYIKNISDGVGEIRIYEPIGVSLRNGKEVGVSGSVFANEMAHLKTVCNKINIRINSDGGSVLDGYAIFSSILNAGVETESFIDGVAASTAGWCAMAANKCSIMDYATLMVHGASGSDDQELISMVNNSIAKMLSNRTGVSLEEANALMSKETWYSASNSKDEKILLEKKYVDEVVNTGKKIKIKKTDVKNLASIYNKIINNSEMSKLNKLLNLGVEAEEKEQEAAVVALNTELTEAKTKVTELTNELKTLKEEKEKRENEAKEALKTRATDLVKAANKAGKISDNEVESYITKASKDETEFAFISNVIGKLGNGKESHKPFDFKNVAALGGAQDRSDWDFTKWSKEDPSGLGKMRNENPEAFQELYNKEFKK